MRFEWMESRRDDYPLAAMCDALGVTRAGYYAWAKRKEAPPGPRAARRQELAAKVREAHRESRRNYGSPRVCRQLKAEGVQCCENTVAKLMREEGIRSKVKRRTI